MYNTLMAKKLTPEEKTKREQDRASKAVADRRARIEARQAEFEAQRRAASATFQSKLSQKDKDAIARVLQPKEMVQDAYRPEGVLEPVFDNDFIKSLYDQLQSRGYLSPAQLATVIRQYDRMIETETLVANWPHIQEGTEVAVLCKVVAIEQRPDTGYGISFKIKMVSHYGRTFHLNTNAKRFLTVAREAHKSQLSVNVQGKAGWVSPDTRIVILDKKGLYFQGL